jgi:glutamine synthetase
MIVEYIWLDSSSNIRSKYRNIHNISYDELNNFNNIKELDKLIKEIPRWNYDGSSTGQAETSNSEILLIPVNYISHPFIEESILCLCENIYYDKEKEEYKSVIGNSRTITRMKILKNYHIEKDYIEKEEELIKLNPSLDHDNDILDVWYGLEQEYFICDKEESLMSNDKDKDKGKYYCSINKYDIKEKELVIEHLKKCIKHGINISGINQEVENKQWEYQIGPTKGVLKTGDHMIFAKYILIKLANKYKKKVVFHPKPLVKDNNGSGCHINISNYLTRDINEGYNNIIKIIKRMSEDHKNFVKEYTGKNNQLRLIGNNEAPSMYNFIYGVGDRKASVRIPIETKVQGYGYFEDRRPGASIDYYKTCYKYLEYM